MRHRNKNKSLSRTSSHRKAMLANMGCSLIMHKRIKTTVAKAKELKRYLEPIITKSKTDSTHSRRVVFSKLKNKDAVKELFSTVAEKILNRPGGYTRIIKLGKRLGDSAEICFIELVDFNDVYETNKEETKKTRRSRRSKSSTNKDKNPSLLDQKQSPTEEEVPTEEEAPAEEEAPVEEEVPTEEEAPAEEEENKEEAEEK